MIRTVEDELFDATEIFDYYKGSRKYSDAQCIYIQILAQVLYWPVDYDIHVYMEEAK